MRAYHFGPKFLVELEMVMNQNTPLHITHDTGIRLQHKIEKIDEVDRAVLMMGGRVVEEAIKKTEEFLNKTSLDPKT